MKKAPTSGDIEVGRRLRVFRLQRQMTQTELGDQLGLTFQQIQKYENGTNRIGAGRLQIIAGILDVPIASFFDRPAGNKGSSKPLMDFIDTAASLRLLRAFERMEGSAVRSAFVKLAEAVAGEADHSS